MLNRTSVTLFVLSIAALGCTSEEPSGNTSEPAAPTSSKAPTDSETTAKSGETDETANAADGEDQNVAGGYSKAAVDDAKVTAAAEFAVTEESRKGTKLSLKSISSAETQVVAGTNYKLVMVIDEAGAEKTVEVVVYEDLQQTMTVTSWMAK